jgi:hypothetical protein
MLTGSRRLLLKFSFVVAMVVFMLSFQPKSATAYCTYQGDLGQNCVVEGCYDEVYCQAIDCFHRSSARGGNGSECCFYNNSARFCGSDCPLFCAAP